MRGLGTLMFVSQYVSLQYVHVEATYLIWLVLGTCWYIFFGGRASQSFPDD